MAMGLITAAIAQTKSISGTITDKDGKAVEGASIQIQGGSTGVTSDAKGQFHLSAKQGETLIITAMNFSTVKAKVGSRENISISLERSDVQLSEVVVTALGIKRTKNSLPYAAQQVSAEELNNGVTTNVVNNLSGKVAGLQITASNTMGGSTNVILRGMRSLTQSNQALFVVDGVPFDNTNQSRSSYDLGNTASDLNPDDIESVSVLKGPAASALYGSRGANGVILITTKKAVRKRGIGVTATVGVTVGSPDKSTLPTYQTEYGQGYGSAGYNGAYPTQDGFFYYTPTFNSNGQRVQVVQTNNDAATGPAYNPNLLVYNWDAFAQGDANYGKATPWMPAQHNKPTDYFVTPVTSSVSVYADGGGDKGTFKIGYSHDDTKDFMPNSYYKKNLFTLGTTYNLTDKVTVGATLNYSDNSATNRYLYPYTGGTSPMTDFRQWWPTNVDIQQQKNDYFNGLKNPTLSSANATWNWQTSAYRGNQNGTVGRPAYHDNLYWFAYTNYENDSRTRYFGNANINYKITNYLSLMGRVSLDNYTQSVETRNDVGSQSTPYYTRFNSSYNETNYDLMLNFDKNISNDFNLKAVLGGNVRQNNIQSISASTNGGLVIPGFFSLSNTKSAMTAPSEVYQKKEVDGAFASATLSWKEMVTVDATLRRDQSSTLPKGNNSYYYPSVSGNFVFSKLLPETKWFSYGKVWANYAQVGGDAPYYSLYNPYAAQSPFNGQGVFSSPTTNNNPNLKPEMNKSYEFGLEANFLKNRIGFVVDYYLSKQIDQIMPSRVSDATGFSYFYVNGGAVQNQGVEVTLNATPVKTKSFAWNISVNWSKINNKVLSLYNGQPSYAIASLQNSLQLVAVTGKPYGVIRGTDYTYLNGQRVIDGNGNYILNGNSLSDIGNMNPDWLGGVRNSVTYKNLSLSFLIDVRKGGQVYSLDMDYGSSSGLYPRTAGLNDLGKPVRAPLSQGGGIILKGVTADGKANTTRIDESDINNGAYTFSSSYGEADKEFVYDASYVKLRELVITYAFPSKLVSKIGFIRGIDFSLTGRNLWIIHKNLPYADPEQGQASGNASMGFQNGAYPTMRTLGAVLKVKF